MFELTRQWSSNVRTDFVLRVKGNRGIEQRAEQGDCGLALWLYDLHLCFPVHMPIVPFSLHLSPGSRPLIGMPLGSVNTTLRKTTGWIWPHILLFLSFFFSVKLLHRFSSSDTTVAPEGQAFPHNKCAGNDTSNSESCEHGDRCIPRAVCSYIKYGWG